MTTFTIIVTLVCMMWSANRGDIDKVKKENEQLKVKIEKIEESKK